MPQDISLNHSQTDFNVNTHKILSVKGTFKIFLTRLLGN